jgi:hypothetical protein
MLDVTIDNDNIRCSAIGMFTKENRVDHLRELEDIIVNHYQGQQIIFEDYDGNNINQPQFVHWLEQLRTALNINTARIVFVTQIPPKGPYQWIPRRDYFRICGLKYKKINKDLSQAKFVGCLNGSRQSPARIRMTYELGKNFVGDAFLTCWKTNALSYLQSASSQWFADEIHWFKNYHFDNDIDAGSRPYQALDMYDASTHYSALWNKFKIEVVVETDEYMHNRLTDKVAKPLVSGKPFLLLCGQNSLKHLRDLGFVTFSDYIDESYDNCVLPAQRIKKIIESLQQLYRSHNRDQIIDKMCQHAVHNIKIYHRVVEYLTATGVHTGFPTVAPNK